MKGAISRLLEADAHWSARLRLAERHAVVRPAAILLAHSGDSWFWGPGLLAAWLLGGPAWKYRAVWLVAGIAVTAVIVQGLKWGIRRERPQGEWGRFYRKTDPHSFPSGHAARVAMLAVLGLALGPDWFALALLIWAPLVAWSRVAMGVHYLSDIAAGLLLGLGIGLAMARLIIPW